MSESVLKPTLSVGQLAQLEQDMRRRGSQQGSLVKRRGSWYAKYRRHVTDDRGNLVYRATSKRLGLVSEMKREKAMEELRKKVAEANALAAAPKQIATFRQFTQSYWWPELSPDWRPRTVEAYEYLLRLHILPTLGDLPLREISPQIVQALLNEKAKRYGKKLVVSIRDLIGHVFKYAKRRGFWAGDIPSEGAKARGGEAKQQQALEPEKANLIVQLIAPRYRPLVLLLRATGLRIGEAMALRWKWVNLTDEDKIVDGTLLTKNSLAVVQCYSKSRWGKPKTPRSRRAVPLSTMAGVALLQMQELDITGGPEDPVFRTKSGRPWHNEWIARKHLKPAAKKAGVPWVSWHTFRHSLSALSTQDLRELLGHTSNSTTRIYRHPEPDRLRGELEKM